jgi:hypothetical protein
MVGQARVVRVVVVSPGDVARERDVTQTVIDELNRTIADERGSRFSLWRWETDARPGLHLEGPQGRIDEEMRIEDADVVVGIFWKRFGTPTADADSGTEHELRRAWAAWRQDQRPEVMVYFCTRAYAPATSAELAQHQRVLAFREALPGQQLSWLYNRVQDFERLLREHLTRFLLAQTAPAPPLQPVRTVLSAILDAESRGEPTALVSLRRTLQDDLDRGVLLKKAVPSTLGAWVLIRSSPRARQRREEIGRWIFDVESRLQQHPGLLAKFRVPPSSRSPRFQAMIENSALGLLNWALLGTIEQRLHQLDSIIRALP